MNYPKVLLLNGPPRCGKDTVGRIIRDLHAGAHLTKFAKLLKERTHAVYGGNLPHDFFEDRKDRPDPFFYGLTPRQAYIEVSERHMKRLHGNRILGEMLVEDIARTAHSARLVVVTDSGFQAEAEVLMGSFECHLMRIHREGCTFTGDSRSYIDLPVPTIDLPNDGSLSMLRRFVARALAELRLA